MNLALFDLEVHSTPPKTNMTLENQPFDDVFPIEHGDFSLSCYFFFGGGNCS